MNKYGFWLIGLAIGAFALGWLVSSNYSKDKRIERLEEENNRLSQDIARREQEKLCQTKPALRYWWSLICDLLARLGDKIIQRGLEWHWVGALP
jgi:hypothetical protein